MDFKELILEDLFNGKAISITFSHENSFNSYGSTGVHFFDENYFFFFKLNQKIFPLLKNYLKSNEIDSAFNDTVFHIHNTKKDLDLILSALGFVKNQKVFNMPTYTLEINNINILEDFLQKLTNATPGVSMLV